MSDTGFILQTRSWWRLIGLLGVAILAANLLSCAPVNRLTGSAPPTRPLLPTISTPKALITVLPGQTVYSIARANGLPLRSLIEENALRPPYLLRVGQTLRLPQVETYIVAAGDTVSTIALRLNVDMRRLVVLNAIHPPYLIQVGQRLRLPRLRMAGSVSPSPTAVSLKQLPVRQVQVPTVMALPLPRPESGMRVKTIAIAPLLPARGPAISMAKAVTNVPKISKRRTNYSPAPRARSKFLVPVNGRVIGRFGPRKGGLHNDGINIAAPIGAPIKAAENGVVAYAGAGFGGFGKLLLIKHADGWISAYGHAQKILVVRGARVRRGQVVATVGKTGGVTRPQLHFELRRGSRALNPEKYIGS